MDWVILGVFKGYMHYAGVKAALKNELAVLKREKNSPRKDNSQISNLHNKKLPTFEAIEYYLKFVTNRN